MESLEAVAKARYILGVTAEYLYTSCVSDDEKWSKPDTRNALDLLFNNVRALCTAGHSRSPALYLLKQLVKRYGGHSIVTISQNEELSWIVPAEFQRREASYLFQRVCYVIIHLKTSWLGPTGHLNIKSVDCRGKVCFSFYFFSRFFSG